MDIKCVAQEESLLGEAPLWSQRDQLLYWVDIFKNQIFAYDPATGKNQGLALPDSPTSLNLKKGGGLLITFKKQIAGFDFKKNEISPFIDIEKELPYTRCNDAHCDAKGRLWVGTINSPDARSPLGSLYRIDPDGTVSRMDTGCACSNGLGWSPDNKVMYFVETFKYAVYAYDFDLEKGTIANKRIFASAQTHAYFDGLTVDATGNIWVALSKEGKILCYSPQGKILRTIDCPVPCPTSCCFGGKELSTLYVTTSRELLSDLELKKYPLSGSLFALECGVKGLPSHPFAGNT